MPSFLIAAAILVGGLWLIRQFSQATPGQASALTRQIGGVACIAGAGFLTLRGQAAIAAPLFVFGVGLMGKSALFPTGFPWERKSSGQNSRVRTSVIAMELDHDTGRMDGEVLTGPLQGKRLSVLTDAQLASLHGLCAKAGDQSLPLLEAWLDRTKPAWREAWGGKGNGQKAQAPSGKMSEEEAFAVLGLKPGAKSEDIRAAHRRLMKEFHPDKGGSDYLAAKINQAKERLLQD
ncbi:MAG: DnaJ domain-containing protein [Hyphomicrobiales bacterium]